MGSTTTRWTMVAALGLLAGCGLFGTQQGPQGSTVTGATEPPAQARRATSTPAEPTAEELAELPEAPWQELAIADTEAPQALLAAWSAASNRDVCAPLAPRSTDGARARSADFGGGWAVEFDVQGMPGITRDGRACATCGRGAFGIAGTALFTDDEDPAEAEELGYRDGSRLRLEAPVGEEDDEGPVGHVASIKIRGQDCVYQVWTMAGEEHLSALVSELRFVRSGSLAEPLARAR